MSADWEATCCIYDIPDSTLTREDSSTRSGCLDVPSSVANVLLVQRLTSNDHLQPWEKTEDIKYSYRFLSDTFEHDDHEDQDMRAIDVHVDLLEDRGNLQGYLAPEKTTDDWLKWINNQATQVLHEEEMSYSVCTFVENAALDFLGTREVRLYHGDATTVLLCHAEADYKAGRGVEVLVRNGNLSVECPTHTGLLSAAERARSLIFLYWKEWTNSICPICFDEISFTEAVEISPCGHLFCRDCIGTYARTVLETLRSQDRNPFTCPVPTCSAPMDLVRCVKGLLPSAEFDLVRGWFKSIRHPPANKLKKCPRRKCGKEGMLKVSPSSTMVYCDKCGVTWCEICLARLQGDHGAESCDSSTVLLFCRRYREAKESVRSKCREKWPWIADYAAATMDDDLALKWAREHASQCPKCFTGIERIEGCFHMQCMECGTHFCYECGERLVPPYYGTHHCWEDNPPDQWGHLDD